MLVTIRYSQVWKLQSNRNDVEVAVHPQKRLLVHVAGVLRRAQQVHGEPEHTLVVGAHQLLERVLVAALGRANQNGFIGLGAHAGIRSAGRVLGHKLRCCPVFPTSFIGIDEPPGKG